MKRKIIIIALILFVGNLPYLLAVIFQNEALRFGGFLLNPADGYSYLAKMQIGQMGDWKFNLLYSPPGSGGAYIFLFYITQGHLSRLTGLSSIVIFHAVRVIASILLLVALERLCSWSIKDRSAAFRAWILVSLGSGIGWLSLPLVGQTSDFWVAEAYPWLSMFSSPHFVLGLAITCWVLPQLVSDISGPRSIILFAMGLILAGVMPFAVVVLVVVVGAVWVWEFIETKQVHLWSSLFFFTPALIYLSYQYFAITNDPYLAAWNQQNITPAPPWWDFILAFSPALILAGAGLVTIIKPGISLSNKIMASWLIVGAGLAYVPFALQRRFMFGYYIPVAAIAVMFLLRFKHFIRYSTLLILMSTLTNLVLLSLVMFGIFTQNPKYYFDREWISFFDCVQDSTDKGTTILAPEPLGILVPAFSGRHVISGHPMESINAPEMEQAVRQFYQGELSLGQVESTCSCSIDYLILPSIVTDDLTSIQTAPVTLCRTDDLILVRSKQ